MEARRAPCDDVLLVRGGEVLEGAVQLGRDLLRHGAARVGGQDVVVQNLLLWGETAGLIIGNTRQRRGGCGAGRCAGGRGANSRAHEAHGQPWRRLAICARVCAGGAPGPAGQPASASGGPAATRTRIVSVASNPARLGARRRMGVDERRQRMPGALFPFTFGGRARGSGRADRREICAPDGWDQGGRDALRSSLRRSWRGPC